MSDFFKKEDEKAEEISKVKVGEAEFTPAELEDLIGAGRKLKDLEDKQGQPVEDILKSWGRRGEEIGNYKKQLEEKDKELVEFKRPKPGEELTEEQQREAIIAEAKKFGLLTRDEASDLVDKYYNERRSGEKMLSRTQKVIRQAAKDGRPEVSVENLLSYMADPDNPKNPQNAYDLMFKKELKDWEAKQLETIKNKGMVTETKVPADKTPEPKKIYGQDALKEALSEHFTNYANQ